MSTSRLSYRLACWSSLELRSAFLVALLHPDKEKGGANSFRKGGGVAFFVIR